MNEIMANIKNRRSRRTFLDRSIPEGTIEEILEAGRYAPSALNKQPWKFIVISNKDAIKRLSDIVRGVTIKVMPLLPLLKILRPELRDPQIIAAMKKTLSGNADTVFHSAPVLILITAAKNASRYAAKDCALAAQNMMLYASSVKISSCFIGRGDLLAMAKEARKILGLPPRHIIHAAIVFGYAPAGETPPTAPPRRKDNLINWVR